MLSQRRAYVTLLSTPDYLPGIEVLAASLRRVRSRHPLFIVVTDRIDSSTCAIAERYASGLIRVSHIENPVRSEDYPHWNNTYSKLQIFGLTQFEKIVFLDADMMVCTNIDDLFERPHFSGVNSGGDLPWHKDWLAINTGLLVIEPSSAEYAKMISLVGQLDTYDHGDQAFINVYFPEWPDRAELHLAHGYNMLAYQMHSYASLFGYRMPTSTEMSGETVPASLPIIRVVHFVGGLKPWHSEYLFRHLLSYFQRHKKTDRQAGALWFKVRREARKSLRQHS
jgi:glycogenin